MNNIKEFKNEWIKRINDAENRKKKKEIIKKMEKKWTDKQDKNRKE